MNCERGTPEIWIEWSKNREAPPETAEWLRMSRGRLAVFSGVMLPA